MDDGIGDESMCPTDEEVLLTANAWFVRLAAAERIENDWLEFEQWVSADPIHDRAFRAIEDARFEMVCLGLLKGPCAD